MTADRFAPAVIDRTGFKHTLYVPKDLLHLPEFLVLESDFWSGHLRKTRPQDPSAVVAGIIFSFVKIDGESLSVSSEVFPVASIPHKALRALGERLFQVREYGLSNHGIPSGLFFIETDDITAAPLKPLLCLENPLLVVVLPFYRHLLPAAAPLEDITIDLLDILPRALNPELCSCRVCRRCDTEGA